MRFVTVCMSLLLIFLCISCTDKNPLIDSDNFEQEGTVVINCVFPETGQSKIASPEAATKYAFVYLYRYGSEYTGKQELTLVNKTASLTLRFSEGNNFAFKVVGYDAHCTITYQGSSSRVSVVPNQTTLVNITMKKFGYASIPAGAFEMGSENGESYEKPVHTVNLDAFEMSTTEVTVKQWGALMPHLVGDDEGATDDTIAASRMTWAEAIEFCNKLSEFYNLKPCYDEETLTCDFSKNGFRLPTEAEWEYACRAGTTGEYYTGDAEEDLDWAGWYNTNSSETIHSVGQKEPNSWGLYDLHGNVAEWCNDIYSSTYYQTSPQNNPHGPESGSIIYVIRGGSYISEYSLCRSATRSSKKYNTSSVTVGFRVVRSVN